MKKLALALIAVGFTALNTQAQVRWDFTDGDAVADQTIANLSNVPVLSRGNNSGTAVLISGTSPSAGYTGASGTNNAGAAAFGSTLDPNTSTYFEFTLTPDAGFAVSATGFEFGSRATTTGPTLLTLRSSIDGFASDISIVSQTADSTWRLLTMAPFSVTGDLSSPITFRLYGSGGTATTGTTVNWRIDDLNFTATAVVPEPGTYMLLGIGVLVCVQQFRRRNN